jgi:hypothetical protein
MDSLINSKIKTSLSIKGSFNEVKKEKRYEDSV